MRRLGWTAASCLWLVAGFAGVTAAPEVLNTWLVPVCWAGYATGLGALMSRLGERGGLFVAVALVPPLLAGYFLCAVDVRHDLMLRERGREVRATVADDRVTSPRGHLVSHYVLTHANGTPVRGGEVSDGLRLHVGDSVTVLEDPRGELAPTTPGHADPTAGCVVLASLLSTAVGAVVWAAFSLRLAAGMRPDPAAAPAYAFEDSPYPVGEALAVAERERLRTELRDGAPDTCGYRTVDPSRYPGLSYPAAAAVAAERGLLAEAEGNRGYWRFAPCVTQQVPPSRET